MARCVTVKLGNSTSRNIGPWAAPVGCATPGDHLVSTMDLYDANGYKKKRTAKLPGLQLGGSLNALTEMREAQRRGLRNVIKINKNGALTQLPNDGMLDKIKFLLRSYLPFVKVETASHEILEAVQSSILW